jgi:hypothetical protein
MADSDAVRSRRKRLHAAGDCSLCRHGGPMATVAAPMAGGSGIDPQDALERLAARLEGAHEQAPGDAALARVLKDTLLALRGPGGTVDRELAEFDAEFSAA